MTLDSLDMQLALGSAAVLAIWTDVIPDAEAPFNEWYHREHMPDRLKVPGFRQGRRYRSFDGAPRYLAIYDVNSFATFSSRPYRSRLDHPTPQTCQIMPNFRNTTRALCRVSASAGSGVGGVLLSMWLSPQNDQRDRLREWIAATLHSLHTTPGLCIVHAQHWEAEQMELPATREAMLRGNSDQSIDWAIIIEASGLDEISYARLRLLGGNSPLEAACQKPIVDVSYRLLFLLNSANADP